MLSSLTEKSSVTATLRTKRDAAAEMEMEEEIEWRLKEMEGGRRKAETGLEMVKRREYGEDEERKRKRERKKLQMHGLVTRGLKTPLVIGCRNPMLRIGNMHFLYF